MRAQTLIRKDDIRSGRALQGQKSQMKRLRDQKTDRKNLELQSKAAGVPVGDED